MIINGKAMVEPELMDLYDQLIPQNDPNCFEKMIQIRKIVDQVRQKRQHQQYLKLTSSMDIDKYYCGIPEIDNYVDRMNQKYQYIS